MATVNDQPLLGAGVRDDQVKHACPECPTPGTRTAGGLELVPSPMCPWCQGRGVLTNAELAKWQGAQWGSSRLR